MRAFSVGAVIVGTIAVLVGLAVANLASATNASNQTCSDLEGNGQDWAELKVDPNRNGTFTSGPLTVTISNTQNDKTFDWTSNIGVDAVYVKAGSAGSSLYRYDPPHEATSGTGLTTPGSGNSNQISHVSFCYDTKSKIIIEKQTLPDGYDKDFNFTSNFAGSFSLEDGEQKVSGLLNPGTYSVSESVPSGWDLTSATCSDGSSPSSIALAADETVKCTFTNSKQSKIIVEKQTIPDNHPQVFDFTGEIEETLGDGDDEYKYVEPGTYSVTESFAGVPSYWKLIDIDCDDSNSSGSLDTRTATYNVEPGETVRCTFTNEKRGLITVVKQTTPDGHQQAFTFNANFDADGFSLADGQSNTSTQLVPGTYSVSENVPSGWTLTSATCSDGSPINAIRLSMAEHVTCTFNNRQNGKIIIEKQTVPADYPKSFDFSGEITAILKDNQIAEKSVAPGTYAVTEAPATFWDVYAITCDDANSTGDLQLRKATFVVEAGETVKCTFFNRKRGDITIVKQTNPDGATQSFSFSASWDANSFSLADGESKWSGALVPGTYSVSEAVPEGWMLESATCNDGSPVNAIQLAPTEDIVCTFVNAKKGSIVVEKQTLPNGDPQVFSFDASYDSEGFLLSDGQQNDSGTLDPGTYSVSETIPDGWDLESAVCSDKSPASAISLQAGETVTCVFTNTKDGRIIVEKQTVPNGDPRKFEFEASYYEGSFLLADGEQDDSGDLDPGSYSVGEIVPVGWDLIDIDCGQNTQTEGPTALVDLGAGETVTCVFTNTKRAAGAINVIKTANPTSVKEPGGSVNFTVTVENTGPVNLTVTSVVDDKFGNLANVAGGSPSGCFAVPFVLAPGTSSTCTFPKDVTGTAGTSHVNTVTASGFDTSENPVSDSDDATVTFTERLIDLVIVKDATSPTPLNEIVTYTMTVTNKGPDTATNVQLADPAPSGITYLSVVPGSPTCTVTASLLTCSLGTLEVGQSRTITLTAKATMVGQHINTATVTGEGGRETNPADNADNAITVVPAPVVPPKPKPTPKPKPEPKPAVCLTLTVTPRMVTADGRPEMLKVRVTAGQKHVKGTQVRVFGAGVKKSTRSKANGIASLRINPKRPGLITITAVEKNRQVCGPKRIGAVGVFLPPLTG